MTFYDFVNRLSATPAPSQQWVVVSRGIFRTEVTGVFDSRKEAAEEARELRGAKVVRLQDIDETGGV